MKDFNYLNGKAIRCRTQEEYNKIEGMIGWFDSEKRPFIWGKHKSETLLFIVDGEITVYGRDLIGDKYVADEEIEAAKLLYNSFEIGGLMIY